MPVFIYENIRLNVSDILLSRNPLLTSKQRLSSVNSVIKNKSKYQKKAS